VAEGINETLKEVMQVRSESTKRKIKGRSCGSVAAGVVVRVKQGGEMKSKKGLNRW
jgi:hypothetical protein